MFVEWFVVGSFAFVVFLIVASVLFLLCAENDDMPGGTIAALVAFLLAWLLLGDLARWVVAHPWWTLVAIPGWIGTGFLLSFPHWLVFLSNVRREYQRELQEYLNIKPNLGMEGWVKNHRFERFRREYGMEVVNDKATPPTFEHNRWRLVNWVTLWPWATLWMIIRDGVIRLAGRLVDCFGGTFQRLSNWMFQETL